MKKKLIVFGAGGFGREVIWQLSEMNKVSGEYDILGFADDAPGLIGKECNGYKIMGDTGWLISYGSEISIVIAVANPELRRKKFYEIKQNPLANFPTVIADGVKLSEYARLGIGCIICFNSIISPNAVLGDFTVSHSSCLIGHDSCLGDFVTLYPGVNISGNVTIGDCCELGTGTNIIQGRKIGKDVVLGAGSVIINDIPENSTAVGVPARVITQRF